MDNNEIGTLSLHNQGTKIIIDLDRDIYSFPKGVSLERDESLVIDLNLHDYFTLKKIISIMIRQRIKQFEKHVTMFESNIPREINI